MLLSTLLIGDSHQVRGLPSLVLGCAVHGAARCGRLVAATLLCARALGTLALGVAERARRGLMAVPAGLWPGVSARDLRWA